MEMKYKAASRIGTTAKHPMPGITVKENGQPANSTGYKKQAKDYPLNREEAGRLGHFICAPITSV